MLMVGGGLQRILAKPKKKDPVTHEMLQKLVADMAVPPTDVRLAAICLLCYAAFLRFDELEKLTSCDVKFSQGKMDIIITSNKTDQYQ